MTGDVNATVDLQVWVRDYAMAVDHVEYECKDALDAFKLSELPPYADMFQRDGFLSYGDDLFHESVSLGLVAEWDGPFEVYVDEGDYDEYLRDRVLREYGRKLREED